jgi:hypothetical protein
VSDPMAAVGEKQLQWLQADLKQQDKDARIVVLTHRPLFDLAPDWDWATQDGAAVIDTLMPHSNVTVPYPSGTPSHDRTYRAPCGQIAHVGAARSALRPKEGTNALERRRTL